MVDGRSWLMLEEGDGEILVECPNRILGVPKSNTAEEEGAGTKMLAHEQYCPGPILLQSRGCQSFSSFLLHFLLSQCCYCKNNFVKLFTLLCEKMGSGF